MDLETLLSSRKIDTQSPDGQKTAMLEQVYAMVNGRIGRLVTGEAVSGGQIHHVYRLHGEHGTAILKIRGTVPVAWPDESIEPKDVKYEKDALVLFSGLEPAVFPYVLGYDRENGALLLTDIAPEGKTLETRLNEGLVDPTEMRSLGRTAARIHSRLASRHTPIRDDDTEAYQERLEWVLGYDKHPVLVDTVEQVSKPIQLTLTDLAPKNIGRWPASGQPTFCDMEWTFLGDPRFALGYMTGHILLHNLDSQRKAAEFTGNVLAGILDEQPTFNVQDPVFQQVAIGSVIYRLHRNAPYGLTLSQPVRERKTDIAFDVLEKGTYSWENIFQKMGEN